MFLIMRNKNASYQEDNWHFIYVVDRVGDAQPMKSLAIEIKFVVPPAGFEPAMVFTHRIKSPFPSAARDMEALNGGTNLT